MKQRFTKRTRLVSALLTLAMVFTFLPVSAFAATDGYGPVYISDTTFPDETFQNYVKQFDTNNNGTLSPDERYAVTEIKVSGGYNGEKITNLKGIEFFPNLLYLDCSENQLSSLNVSDNTELMMLLCYQNELNSLDVTRNPALITLNCSKNNLTSLDVSKHTALTNLNCSENNLTSLNVSKNENLETLHCYDNQLTNLDVTQFIALQELYCSGNQLTDLNVSQNTVLRELWCSGNPLTDLNVSQNTALQKLWCSENPLTELDVRKNAQLEVLQCKQNQLTELDVSKNAQLKSLDCDQNSLASLDVRSNAALEYLWCSKNQLTSLDVSKNPALKYLYCYENNLTSLDVSQNPALLLLSCDGNQLTSLDLSQTAVAALGVSDNKITIEVEETSRTFDLSKLPGKFDVTKVTKWNGGTVNGNTLTVNENVTQVTYTYNCGRGFSGNFTLNVNVVPDGSTGGGSTGGGSTGGSTGGGGTTIPPEAGKYQLTVTDGVATVNGITGDVLNVKPGDTVTLTADTTKFPENEEFGWWEITPYGSVSNTLTGQYQRTATFTMPNENVSARAMSKSAGVSTGGDDGGGGGGAAILLVGGAAVAGLVGYGVYSYVSEQQLKALLPEGVAMPENRAQTALLLWNTAGRPEPAEAPAFKDVADPDTAKAAQWCVEHGLMDQKLGGRFAPDNSDPAYKTLNAYQQLVPTK